MHKLSRFHNQEKVNQFLLTSKYNPFPAPPASTDFLENPAEFIIGRDNELNQINSAINESLKYPESKLMFIQGKQGIGKSTIISSVPRYLEESGLNDKVLIVYFNTSNDPNDFHFLNFYRQAISVLDKTGFLEQLVFSTLQKIILLGRTEGGKLREDLEKMPLSPDYLAKLTEDASFLKLLLFEKVRALQSEIKRFIKQNYRILRSYINIDNFNFLFTLVDCFIGEEAFSATNALQGTGEHHGFKIDTDNLAQNVFNDLKKLTRWVYGEATFLIIFDHLERGLSNPEKVYHALFSLLLGLRQQSYTCILVSGTLDAFRGLYKVLEEDMRLQLDNWLSFYETLRPLSINSVVNITKRHLNNFWTHSNFQPPYQYSLYPFGEESVAYLYDSTNEDIRRTLIELHRKIDVFKQKQKVDPVIDFFEALAQLRQGKSLIMKSREINVLAGKLLDPQIQDKTRSTKAEIAIFELLKIIRKSTPEITEVKHEPPVGKHKLKPDIYFELFGGLTLKQMKKIAIEVKIFRKTNEVSKKEVKKTHSMVVNGDIDQVIWITTVPLSSVKHDLPDKFKALIGRTSPLSKEEQAYLALTIHFEEIFKRKPDPQEADFLLKQIGISLKTLINDFKDVKEVKVIEKVIKEAPRKITERIAQPTITSPPIRQKVGRLKKKEKDKLIPSILIPSQIKKPSIIAQAKDINNKLSLVITELSATGKKYVYKTTIIKELKKLTKIRTLSKEDEERMDILITEIGKKKGLKVRPTRIYFS